MASIRIPSPLVLNRFVWFSEFEVYGISMVNFSWKKSCSKLIVVLFDSESTYQDNDELLRGLGQGHRVRQMTFRGGVIFFVSFLSSNRYDLII